MFDQTSPLASMSTLALLSSLLLVWFLASSIYSLTLHPLASFPGPKLCAISRLPYWNEYFRGRDTWWMHELHKKYGPVVRFGPTDLSYSTGEAWKDINGHKKGAPENDPAREIHVQPVNGVRSMLSATHEDHARVRRLFSPAFSDRSLKKQEHLFREYADLLVWRLHQAAETQEAIEMTQLFNFTTFDIMSQLCFGHSLGMLQKNEPNLWVQSVFASLKMLPFASFIAYYPIINAVFTRFEPAWVTAQRRAHCQFSADRVDERLKEGSNKPDVWNLVLTANENDEEKLSLAEMHSNAELFMLAGSETTATLLSGITYLLLTNPEPLKRLKAEIRIQFSKPEDLTFEKLAESRYLHACVKEALRVYPPAPLGVAPVIPKQGQAVLGKWIPGDTRASIHQFSTFHSAENFRDPDDFVPERWLGDPRYADDARDAHQPFGYGPRNCLGQNMAMYEVKLILTSIILQFDFTLCDSGQEWLEQRTYGLWMKNPLLCRVSKIDA